MKNILRNFLITLRSYPLVVTLNIAGLGVAISVAYMIAVQVYYELSYNKGIKDAERIVRIEMRGHIKQEPEKWEAFSSENFLDTVSDIVGVESLGVLNINEQPNRFTVGDANIPLSISFASDDVFEILPFEIVEGSVDNLLRDSNVLISESFAKRYNLKVGSTLERTTQGFHEVFFHNRVMTVVAIYKDFKKNSDFAALDVIVSMGKFSDFYRNSKYKNYYVAYAKLTPGYTAEELSRAMNEKIAAESPEAGVEMRAMPLTDSHFYGAEVKALQKGSLTGTIALIAIAVVLLAIAFVNYLNFFLSLIPRRIRSVNTHKIMGASVLQMRVIYVIESIIMVIISVAIALLIVSITVRSELSTLFTAHLSLFENWEVVSVILCVALLFAVIVALYPAFYVTSFTPALALNGNYARNKGGTRFRLTLIIMQFVISFVLIIVALFIRLQNSFMLGANVGFDKESVLVATPNASGLGDHAALCEKLCEHPGIVAAALGDADIISHSPDKCNVAIIGESNEDKGTRRTDRANIVMMQVSSDFSQVMGLDIYEGCTLEYDELPAMIITKNTIEFMPGGYICNEQARKLYSLNVGDCIDGTRTPIVGFCRDFKYRPLQYDVEPLAIGLNRVIINMSIYVRVAPGYNLKDVAEYMRATTTEYFETDNSSMEVQLIDDIMRSEYKDEQLKALQISSFATVSIIVSLMGLLATVLFEVRYMEREIALRRVNGATVWSVIGLINKKYFTLVVLSFLIALPVAVYSVREWLSNFAYRTDMYWWVFALVFLMVSAVAVVVVTLTAWRTVNRNPIEVLNKG